jgi:hypothetical protein
MKREMMKTWRECMWLNQEIYLIPFEGRFNLALFVDGVSSLNDVDTLSILNGYALRFSDAWKELATK